MRSLALTEHQLLHASPSSRDSESRVGSQAVVDRLVQLERQPDWLRLQRQLQHIEQHMQDVHQGILSQREAFVPIVPMRGTDDKLVKDNVRVLAARMDALEACLAGHRQDAEARFQLVEMRVEGLAAVEDFKEPKALHAVQGGALSSEQRLADSPELEKLRSLAKEMRKQQAKLAVGRAVRAQEEEGSHEMLADFQDIPFEAEHQEPEAGASPTAAPALEARLAKMEQRIAEAVELASASKKHPSIIISAPAEDLQPEELPLSKTPTKSASSVASSVSSFRAHGLEVTRRPSDASSVPDFEGRLAELRGAAMEHSCAASSALALEERMLELEEGLIEARASAASAFPALEDRLLDLEHNLHEATKLFSGASSIFDLEKRLLEIEQVRFTAKDFDMAVNRILALEARLSNLVDDLPEAKALSRIVNVVPVLEARLCKLECGLLV